MTEVKMRYYPLKCKINHCVGACKYAVLEDFDACSAREPKGSDTLHCEHANIEIAPYNACYLHKSVDNFIFKQAGVDTCYLLQIGDEQFAEVAFHVESLVVDGEKLIEDFEVRV